MKRLLRLFAVAALSLMFYVPAAHAQYGSLPNQGAWDNFLANHPKTASELQRNPSLFYNPNWRKQHTGLEDWLNNHKGDWQSMRRPAPWRDRYDAWDGDEWRDQDWWYYHRSDWAREHHPEWWREHQDWKSGYRPGEDQGYRGGEAAEEREEQHEHEPRGKAYGYHEHSPGSPQGPGNGHGHRNN